MTIAGMSPDQSHASVSKVPQSLVVRACTRRTYRAVLSEGRVVVPEPAVGKKRLRETEPPPAEGSKKKRKNEAILL